MFYVVIILLGLFGCGISCVYAMINFDRIIVKLMMILNIPAFPEAIAIAMLIVEQPDEWVSHDNGCTLSHRDVGYIWIANDAYGIYLHTKNGKWKPNTIERRIIRNAVDWRITHYIKHSIVMAISRNQITSSR